MLWKLTREAARYKLLYVTAILATLGLTVVNLAAPRVLSALTGVVEAGTISCPSSAAWPWFCSACICCGCSFDF